MMYYDSKRLVVEEVTADTKQKKIDLLLHEFVENVNLADTKSDLVFGASEIPYFTDSQTKIFDEIVDLDYQHYLFKLFDDQSGMRYEDDEIICQLKLNIGAELYGRMFYMKTGEFTPLSVERVFQTNYRQFLEERLQSGEPTTLNDEDKTPQTMQTQLSAIKNNVEDCLSKSIKISYKEFIKLFRHHDFVKKHKTMLDHSDIKTVRIFEEAVTIVGDFDSKQLDADMCYIKGELIITQTLQLERCLLVDGNVKANAANLMAGSEFIVSQEMFLLNGLYIANNDSDEAITMHIEKSISTPLVFSAVEESTVSVGSFVEQPTYILGYVNHNRLGEETLIDHRMESRILVSQLNFDQKAINFKQTDNVIKALIQA